MDALKRAFGTTLPAPVAMRVSLPAHIAHSKALHASVSRCLLLALCLTWLGLLGSAAWGVDLLLFSWWLLLRGGVCGYRLEIKQTQQKLISMRATWSKAASELVDIRRRLESSVQKQLDSAEKALKHYEALPPKLNAKLNLLEKDRERYQQEEFLQRYPIEHCTANSIGPQRKATLRSFGIETAWDIESTRILAISGFGQTYTDELLAWRSKLLAKFRFDPNKAVSPREREQLIAHHNQVMLESERHLESALANVKALANQVESEQFRAVEHANRIAPDFAEAQGQLTALQAL
jgi:DNA-binding helix-hairpin-helix protein with protein kinase domain